MESAHNIVVEPNDKKERAIASQGKAPEPLPPKPARITSREVQSTQAEKRAGYFCIPLPTRNQHQMEQRRVRSIVLPTLPATAQSRLATPPSSAVFGALRPVIEDTQSLDKDELVRRLRAKIKDCEELQQRNRVLALERDEYIEALRISEELRGA